MTQDLADRWPGRLRRSIRRRALLVGGICSAAMALGLGSAASALAAERRPRAILAALASAPPADDVLSPAGRQPGQLADLITPNAAFYTVSKNAAGDPAIDAAAWRMVLDGELGSPVQLDYATLLQLPRVDVVKTLECISNLTAQCELAPFGCDLISTAVWSGVRLADVLALAGGLKAGASTLLATSADEFTSAFPAQVALDPDTLLVYGMNGVTLPVSHGFPARVLVPGRYGYKSAKWVVQLTAVNGAAADWYGQRAWSASGLVKTMARIDTPASQAVLPAGRHQAAGIAYAGARGIATVELSVDGGQSWQPASLLEQQPGRDSWVRWQSPFDLASGQRVELVVRCLDGTGAPQIETFSLPQPDGGSGLHSVIVRGA